MIKILCPMFTAAILACVGCSVNSVTSTNANGDSVSNLNGKGVGHVAGVKIEILGLAKKKNAAVTHSAKVVEGPVSVSETENWDVIFGEVNLIFDRAEDGTISLTIDGQDFGEVSKGDQLSIDEERNVQINGVERSPTS